MSTQLGSHERIAFLARLCDIAVFLQGFGYVGMMAEESNDDQIKKFAREVADSLSDTTDTTYVDRGPPLSKVVWIRKRL